MISPQVRKTLLRNNLFIYVLTLYGQSVKQNPYIYKLQKVSIYKQSINTNQNVCKFKKKPT